jgi:cyanophycinase
MIVCVLALVCGCRPHAVRSPLETWSRKTTGDGYVEYLIGDPADRVATPKGGLALFGGAASPRLDPAFAWFMDRAGGGDVVVLRATDADVYNADFARVGRAHSIDTLVILSQRGASDPFVLARVRGAEAVFVAGGDQSNYVRYWRGTPLVEELAALVARGGALGGTSAGLAVLGQFVYSAIDGGSLKSAQALGNPYDTSVTLERQFLTVPFMAGVVTDSHFGVRDRMGRTLVFMARALADGWTDVARGIAVDEDTAVAVEPDGRSTVFGSRAAYFLRATGKPEQCRAGQPLRFGPVEVFKMVSGGAFDLPHWVGSGGTSYALSVADGHITSTAPGGSVY